MQNQNGHTPEGHLQSQQLSGWRLSHRKQQACSQGPAIHQTTEFLQSHLPGVTAQVLAEETVPCTVKSTAEKSSGNKRIVFSSCLNPRFVLSKEIASGSSLTSSIATVKMLLQFFSGHQDSFCSPSANRPSEKRCA
jgi:hypothetical protein